MNADDLVSMNEQIAAMARAGLPLDRGLSGLAKDLSHGRLRRVTESLADDLRTGKTLPESLANRGKELPPFYASLVAAGIRTGRLPEVLATLTTYARSVAATRITIVDALFYPLIVIAFASAMFVLLVFFVIPQFDAIYRDFGLSLPALTELLMAVGRHPVEWILLPAGIVLVATLATWVALRLTPAGRRRWARILYGIPIFGTLLRAARLAAFTDLLAMLVEYEVPLTEAFRLAGDAAADPVMGQQARATADDLAAGQPLGSAIRGHGLVPEWVVWMAGTGEKQGNLGTALRQVAKVYHRQVESRAAMLRTLFPPFAILVTAGVMTGVFVFALMLPMIKLLEGLSK